MGNLNCYNNLAFTPSPQKKPRESFDVYKFESRVIDYPNVTPTATVVAPKIDPNNFNINK